MTLLELVKKASEHYDGGLEPYYDERTGEPRYHPNGGDTLAYFVVCELERTFDPDADGDAQSYEARRVIMLAAKDLENLASHL